MLPVAAGYTLPLPTSTTFCNHIVMSLIHLLQILVLAIVQGAAELLPVSSSAHVTIAARLMGYDMSRVFEWTFLLVMLHTGTMFSVLVYFWSRWKKMFNQIPAMIVATIATGVVGYPLMKLIKHFLNRGNEGAQTQEIEHLFQNLPMMACALASVGVLIIIAGRKDEKSPGTIGEVKLGQWSIDRRDARFGAAVSWFFALRLDHFHGLLLDIVRARAEEFSFALAVIITPVVIAREVWMLIKEHAAAAQISPALENAPSIGQLLLPGLLGMVFSFLAGLVALVWLSDWLEHGRWKFFGYYCLVAAAVVLAVHFSSPG